MTRVDFTGVSDTMNYRVLPAGNYLVVVDTVERKQGPNGEYLNFRFQVQNGEFHGENLWMIASMAPKALSRFKKTLQALNADGTELTGVIEFNEEVDFNGLFVKAKVGQQLYNGHMQNKVEEIFCDEEVKKIRANTGQTLGEGLRSNEPVVPR